MILENDGGRSMLPSSPNRLASVGRRFWCRNLSPPRDGRETVVFSILFVGLAGLAIVPMQMRYDHTTWFPYVGIGLLVFVGVTLRLIWSACVVTIRRDGIRVSSLLWRRSVRSTTVTRSRDSEDSQILLIDGLRLRTLRAKHAAALRIAVEENIRASMDDDE
jgi:hypothetical protein